MRSLLGHTLLGRWGRHARAFVALGLTAGALSGCKDVLEVNLPASLGDSALDDPTGAVAQLQTVMAHFESAYNAATYELFGREDGGQVALASPGTDSGTFTYGINAGWFNTVTPPGTTQALGGFTTSRMFAIGLHDRLEDWTDAQVPDRKKNIAMTSIYEGATLNFLGSALCEVSLDAGPLMTRKQTLDQAETTLTRALTEIDAAGGDFAVPYGISTSAKQMAYGLRAQVKWMNGKLAEAASDAALVQNGFKAYVTREATTERRNKAYFAGPESRYAELYGIIDFWDGVPNPVTGKAWPKAIPFTGYRELGILPDGRAVREDGLPIRVAQGTTSPARPGDQVTPRLPEENTAVPDTRVKFIRAVQNGSSTNTYINARYTSEADDIPFVNWKEMILIRAEAVGGQGAIDLVNQIRTADGLPKVTYLTGATATSKQILDMIIEERRRSLYLEGRYFFTKLQHPDFLWFPRGVGSTAQSGFTLQGGVTFLMPETEYVLNPNLTPSMRGTGCDASIRPVNY